MMVSPALSLTNQSFASETLTDPKDLEHLQTDWWALWSRCPDSTPFQSPAWVLPWWKHLGEGQLCTIAFRQQDQLVGLAPLCIYHDAANGARRLLLLGTGVSDYLDVLVEPDFKEQVLSLFVAWLSRNPAWDHCDFHQLRPG